jgi:3',5'-cyclic AMP phosphodiesterase CpdA
MHPIKQTASGYIYEQGSNLGIPSVMVSNQRQVVLTDENGYYELPLEEDCSIIVTKPAAYTFPVNEYQQPQFYYLYRPNGSPEPERLSPYPAIDPTGEVPNPLNFYLIKTEPKAEFTAVLMGDIQPETSKEVEYFRRLAVPALQQEQADFMIPLGDLAWDELEVHPEVQAAIGEIGKPWHVVMGNHDINIRATQNRFARESFQYFFGPTYYSFDYGQVHFVVLDDVDYSGWNLKRDEQGITEGRLDVRQLEWLANDLALVPQDKLVFILSHIPIYTKTAAHNPYRNIMNRRDLFALLKNRPYLFAASAHTHTIEQVDLKEGGWEQRDVPFPELISGAICGAWWQGPLEEDGLPVRMAMDGAPNGYFVFRFSGTSVKYQFKALGVPESKSRYILRFPRNVGLSAGELVVNAFATPPDARIEVSWNGGNFVPLKQFEGTDAYVTDFLTTHRDKYDIWMGAKVNLHLWKGELPKGLGDGKHQLEVRIVEKNGEQYGGVHFLEVNTLAKTKIKG